MANQRIILILHNLISLLVKTRACCAKEGVALIPFARADCIENHVAQYVPEGLILDTHLPGRSGIQICSDLKGKKTGRIPFVFLVSRAPSKVLEVGAEVAKCDLFVSAKEADEKIPSLLKWIWVPKGELVHVKRASRFPIDSPIQIQFGAKSWFGKTINASRTGMLLALPKPLPAGRYAKIKFPSKAGDEVDVRVEIVRSKVLLRPDADAGLWHEVATRFVDVNAQNARKLHSARIPTLDNVNSFRKDRRIHSY